MFKLCIMFSPKNKDTQLIIFFQHHAINPSTSLRAAWAFLFILLAPLFTAERTFAHEVWIEPHSAHLSKGENLLADLRIGDMFKGDHLIYIPQQTEKLLVLMESGSFDLQPKNWWSACCPRAF